MRITMFLLLFSVIQVMAKSSYSQSTMISLNLKDASIVNVLDEIENQSEFYFLYNQKLVNVDRKVDVNTRNKKISDILSYLFDGEGINYLVMNRQIVLSPQYITERVDVAKKQLAQADNEVKGIIVDEEGNPLPGVNIIIKGTTQGSISDADGNYRIELDDPNVTLVFSFIGYKHQEVLVGNQTTINIVLLTETIELEEVVAIGYGTQLKKNLTGAVDVVKEESLEMRPISNTGEGLQGVVPNLNITVLDGDPSSNPLINIRGFESITGGSPLILIDGAPGNLNIIDPDDIKSITILKDAASASIYGARGAFGVILVQTKEGRRGAKPEINFNVQFQALQPIWKLDDRITDPYEYVTIRNQMSMRTNGANQYNEDYVANCKQWSENPTTENAWGVKNGVLQYYGYNNYEEQVLKDFAPSQDYNLNFKGGTKTGNYFGSINYMNKEGVFKIGDYNYKRYNVLFKSGHQITDWLTINQRISYNVQDSDKPNERWSNYDKNTLANISPISPIRFPSTDYFESPDPSRDYSQYEGMYIGTANWFALTKGGRQQFTNHDLNLSPSITINPLRNLEFRGEFFYQFFHRKEENFVQNIPVMETLDLLQDNLVGFGFTDDDHVRTNFSDSHYYTINIVSEYEFDEEGIPHYFKAMVGYNQEWTHNNYVEGIAYDLISQNIIDVSATMGKQALNGGRSEMSLRGAFYRLNYIYDNRYLIELNGRYDGSSRFPKKDRFGFFPSFSAGWRISEERFMSGNVISDLKLRLSYGSLGNQMIGSYYPYITSMPQNQPYTMESNPAYLMGGNYYPFIMYSGLVSPSLTWETVSTKNIGMDIGFFDNKLTATFDAYIRETKDMLMRKSYPSILGASAPSENAADLETKGWELNLTYNNTVSNDFSYDIGFNLSDWNTTITKYENETGAINDYYVGMKIGEIWGLETVGLFQSEEEVAATDQSMLGANWKPGDVHYADLDENGKIDYGNNVLDDVGDRKIIGNNTASYRYGITFNVRYKSLSLRAFFQGVGKRDYYPRIANHRWFFPGLDQHLERYFVTESWSEDNRDAYFYAPSIQIDEAYKNIWTQTRYLQDASYIRLKNLSLIYAFPSQILSRVGMKGAMVYISIMNLWEYSKIHKPLDPEYIFQGNVPYPLQRTYSVGVRITL